MDNYIYISRCYYKLILIIFNLNIIVNTLIFNNYVLFTFRNLQYTHVLNILSLSGFLKHDSRLTVRQLEHVILGLIRLLNA